MRANLVVAGLLISTLLQHACVLRLQLEDPILKPPPQTTPSEACGATTGVATAGWELCVEGEPYVALGVNYGPQHEESCGSIPFYEAVAFNDLLSESHHDALTIGAAGMNTIRIYTPMSAAIEGDDCSDDSCWIGPRHFAALREQGLRLIVTISSEQAFRDRLHVKAARKWADEDVVMALQVGNEMNHNSLYGQAKDPDTLVSLSNTWIDEIRRAGWSQKPVILGWGHPASKHRETLRKTTADIVAYQLYERLSLRTSNGQDVFDWHRTTFDGISADKRPGMVTEFGADSINVDKLDEGSQAYAVGNLVELILADAQYRQWGGGMVFSWVDNWGKATGDGTNSCAHDRKGNPGGSAGPHPDGIYHEEWFGMMRRDRTPRKAYHTVKRLLSR